MKAVSVIAIATRTPSWISERESEYATRMVNFRLQARLVRPSSPEKETAAVLRCVPQSTSLYVLAATGTAHDSDSFSAWLRKGLESSSGIAFVVGGATGVPQPLLAHAAGMLSLSPLTFAHGVARLVLAEQLFRADCMMRGHPYPK